MCNFTPQTVQHKLAELKTDICVGRAFIDNCIQLHAEKRLDAPTASMAKFWWEFFFVYLVHATIATTCYNNVLHPFSRASDLQNKVSTQCLQLHGGWGYMWEYPIAKWVLPNLCSERAEGNATLFELLFLSSQGVCGLPRSAHLRRHQRDHERADRPQHCQPEVSDLEHLMVKDHWGKWGDVRCLMLTKFTHIIGLFCLF